MAAVVAETPPNRAIDLDHPVDRRTRFELPNPGEHYDNYAAVAADEAECDVLEEAAGSDLIQSCSSSCPACGPVVGAAGPFRIVIPASSRTSYAQSSRKWD